MDKREEEYDNEKNSEFDKSNDSDHDRDLGEMNFTSHRNTSTNKYVITPSQIEYHYQEKFKNLTN